MKEIQRYYIALFTEGASMSFRADNKELAQDHADHVAFVENLGKTKKITFIGREEPADCGVIARAL